MKNRIITIVYTELGRAKVCVTKEYNAIKYPEKLVKYSVEELIVIGAREFLMSQEVEAVKYEKNKYNIVVGGLRTVGKAEII